MAVVVRSVPVYISRAERRVAFDTSFRCAACGFASPVRVWADGTGEHQSRYRPNPSGPQYAAQTAEARAWDLARARHERLSCPHCGRRCERDLKDVASKRIKMIVLAVLGFLGLIAGVVVYLLDDAKVPDTSPVQFGVLSALIGVAGLIAYATAPRALKGVSGANQFAQFAGAYPQPMPVAQPAYAAQRA